MAFILSGILMSCLDVFLTIQAALSLQWKDEGKAGSICAYSWMPWPLQAEEESQPDRAYSYIETRGMPAVLSLISYGSDLWRISVFAVYQGVNFKVSSTVLLMKI